MRLVPGDIYFKSWWGGSFWETIFGGWLQSDLGGFVGGVEPRVEEGGGLEKRDWEQF